MATIYTVLVPFTTPQSVWPLGRQFTADQLDGPLSLSDWQAANPPFVDQGTDPNATPNSGTTSNTGTVGNTGTTTGSGTVSNQGTVAGSGTTTNSGTVTS